MAKKNQIVLVDTTGDVAVELELQNLRLTAQGRVVATTVLRRGKPNEKRFPGYASEEVDPQEYQLSNEVDLAALLVQYPELQKNITALLMKAIVPYLDPSFDIEKGTDPEVAKAVKVVADQKIKDAEILKS